MYTRQPWNIESIFSKFEEFKLSKSKFSKDVHPSNKLFIIFILFLFTPEKSISFNCSQPLNNDERFVNSSLNLKITERFPEVWN